MDIFPWGDLASLFPLRQRTPCKILFFEREKHGNNTPFIRINGCFGPLDLGKVPFEDTNPTNGWNIKYILTFHRGKLVKYILCLSGSLGGWFPAGSDYWAVEGAGPFAHHGRPHVEFRIRDGQDLKLEKPTYIEKVIR